MKKNILFLLLSLWVVSSCSDEEQPAAGEPQPIRFAFYMKDGGKEMPMSRAVAANLKETGISLYCSYHTKPFDNIKEDGSEPACPKVYWNTSVDANGNAKDGIPRFWMMSASAYYTFWAHSDNPSSVDYPPLPSGIDVKKWGVTGGGQGTSTHKNAVCSFIQPDDPRKQIDLLIADMVKDQQAVYIAPVVGLYFGHFLSRIKIQFYNSHGTQLNDCVAKISYGGGGDITKQVIRGFDANLASASGYLNTNNYGYGRGGHTGTYPLHDGTFTLPATITSSDYAYLAGDLILVPQKVNDGFITVTLYYTPEGKTEQEKAEVEIPAPPASTMTNHSQTSSSNTPYYGSTNTYLQKGYAYTYNINVIVETNSLKIGEVLLSSWEGQNSTVVDWTDY